MYGRGAENADGNGHGGDMAEQGSGKHAGTSMSRERDNDSPPRDPADHVIAVIAARNANAYYELGIYGPSGEKGWELALEKKRREALDELPFTDFPRSRSDAARARTTDVVDSGGQSLQCLEECRTQRPCP